MPKMKAKDQDTSKKFEKDSRVAEVIIIGAYYTVSKIRDSGSIKKHHERDLNFHFKRRIEQNKKWDN